MSLFPFEKDENLLPFDGEVNYISNFISIDRRKTLFDELLSSIPWENETLIMFGNHLTLNRKIAWMADQNVTYQYSNKIKIPVEWSTCLYEIKTQIEKLVGKSFNGCLLNLYHDGNDYMGWHTDDEPDLVKHSTIASLSLGAERKFSFKHKNQDKKLDILLENGSLLLMKGETQDHWKHQLPKSLKVKEPRINLTFRQMRER